MCGIFSILNNSYSIEDVENAFKQGYKRGPESSVIKFFNDKNFIFGFHRLAINGFKNPKSEQPLKYNDCILICNGEIYNWKYLHTILNIPTHSMSDCEIIIHLYKKFGMYYTLQLLDGVFAFALYDMQKEEIYFARDTFGIRPLFYAYSKDCQNICFSSVIKCFTPLEKYGKLNVKQQNPGSYSLFKKEQNIWNFVKVESFINLPAVNCKFMTFDNCDKLIYDCLTLAVKKRIDNTDRPIACLLSGGLDSSLITAIVQKNLPKNVKLHTWSIGFQGSEDLFYAQVVADFLGTIHHSIVVKEQDFLDAIPDVIEAIESYDTTTVRASVGNWLISKYIKENSDAKVVFNGDGSDELSGGYMYFHCAPNQVDFDFECRRLLKDIHYFDVLRSDRSISSHGLEARTPFLDITFVQNYLSIPQDLRYRAHQNGCEKFLIRNAFDKKNLLPKEVLWRTKEAFSDGVSSDKKAWYEVIQDHLKNINYTPKYNDDEYADMHNPPTTLEQKYYRDIFLEKFYGHEHVIPYFWMPKFVEATDASARTLKVYKSKQKDGFRK
tara:strand:- start:3365 stop:5017 length:1653 start_codon:yes stop_codon:yes gene_type:complete